MNQKPTSAEQSVEDGIYAQIRDAIANQKLPPGTRLREDEMRQIFAVSRDRIRKVFARLAYDRMVVIEANRGASVAKPSVKEAREHFEARRGIEATIVAATCKTLSPSDIKTLEDHINRERQADKSRNYDDMISLSAEFHTLLAEVAGNTILSRFLVELITRESLIIQAYERPGKPSCSCHEHALILQAIEAGKSDRAVALMSEHLRNIEERLDLSRDERASISLSDVFSKGM